MRVTFSVIFMEKFCETGNAEEYKYWDNFEMRSELFQTPMNVCCTDACPGTSVKGRDWFGHVHEDLIKCRFRLSTDQHPLTEIKRVASLSSIVKMC